ncbi:MAG: multiheme c-type cytochrome [Planctomycetota bacterium]|nr:multiheme c-type cytochrome [Planctomycetota bacterium]
MLARRPRTLLLSLVAGLLVGAPGCGEPSRSGAPAPPAEATSDFIGVAACKACHPGEHATWHQTSHSRALRAVDPHEYPLPHEATHAASGLTYRVFARDKRLIVESSLRRADGATVAVLGEHAMRYAIGSGNRSASFAAEIDGFLVEAPQTWYRAPNAWGMSPGYDVADHADFTRPLDMRCLTCHVGRTERVGDSGERIRVLEDAIGCERCHGPGRAHAAARAQVPEIEGPDPTIVHPARLGRARQMEVCAQCHLDHTLTVERHDAPAEAWRPGRPLDDYQITYRLVGDSDQMTVVGHVDQILRSRCYVESGTLTCLTCHDPHAPPEPDTRQAYFRDRCLTCHDAASACRMPQADRTSAPHGDDCVACHMPRGDTEIPHFAFTDHRIAIHRGSPPAPAAGPDAMALVPAQPIRGLAPAMQDRHLAFAYLLLAVRRPEDVARASITPAEYRACLAQARSHLERAYSGGIRDAAALGALAFLVQSADPARALALARAAAASDEPLPPHTRCSNLQVLTSGLVQAGLPEEALTHLDTLIALRRDAGDWGLRAMAHKALAQRKEAMDAVDAAVRIAGHDPSAHEFAAEIYSWAGDPVRAEHHRALAALLRRARGR